MPQRNSSKKIQLPNIVLRRSPRSLQIKPPDPEHQKTSFNDVLRRSPRFVQIKPPDSEYPKTPSLPQQRKIVSSRKRISKSKEFSGALKESNSASKCSDYTPNLPRKPRILNRLADVYEEKASSSCNGGNRESRRPTTRSCCRDADKISKNIDYSDSTGSKCVVISKYLRGKSMKKQPKDSGKCRNDDCDRADEDVLDDEMNKGLFSIKEHRVLDNESPEKHIDKLGNWESSRPKTRSSCRDADKISEKIDYSASTRNENMHKTEECVGISKRSRGKSMKKQLKDSEKGRNDDCDKEDEDVLDDEMNKGVFPVKEHHGTDDGLPEKHIDKMGKRTDCTIDKAPKRVGTKRKRNHAEDNVKINQGWTKDQELALERAYLTANPTPHFWKKVSRLVPGKSAQQCFDKIHCSHLTPPQLRNRSKALTVSENTHLSASKLLNSPSQKVKRSCSLKQKGHVLQRTVRHMLQKQYKVEKDSETDLFSVLEPTLSSSHRLFMTPDCNKFKGELPNKYQEGSSTSHRKNSSRFSRLSESPIISPPVLKPVKNMVLHEKYIDRLNCRKANMKAASLNEERKGIKHQSFVHRKDAIKAAKFALAFKAKDAISRFQDQQIKALSSIFDDESGSDNETEGEDFS